MAMESQITAQPLMAQISDDCKSSCFQVFLNTAQTRTSEQTDAQLNVAMCADLIASAVLLSSSSTSSNVIVKGMR